METDNRPAISLSTSVGKEIRKLLIDLDMKQLELATRLGENEMWISRRLRGSQPIDLNDLERIALALDVEVADLMPKREGKLIAVGGTTRTPARESKPWNLGLPDRPRPTGPPSRNTAARVNTRTGRVHAALAAA